MTLPIEVISASGISVVLYKVLRHIWEYVRKNGMEGEFSVKLRIGPVPKPVPAASRSAVITPAKRGQTSR